ncbi:MAG: type II secretion system major pseudopilin GspG [Deltaproteobacteria bacterium]|nr:type II secretion system major pseudopilin GspG [Deltaproteobacteria bacterium]
MNAHSFHRVLGDRRGMTLVEIMVVITIIVSLMAVLSVTVLSRLADAQRDQTKIQIRQVEQGLQMYAMRHKGRFPATSDGLAAAAKYMPKSGEVPKDAWGNEFQYFSPGTHGDHEYEIISLGRDGKEGGEDADADILSWALDEEEE